LFALYLVPRKFSTLPTEKYVMFVTLGFFIPAVLQCFALDDPHALLDPTALLLVLVGISWMAAFALVTLSMDKIGLSRSNQWQNLKNPIAVILSLSVLSEHRITNIFIVLAAAALIFVSAVLFSIKKDSEKAFDMRGVYLALGAAFLFGVNSVLLKYATMNVTEIAPQQFYLSGGAFLSAFALLYWKEKALPAAETVFSRNCALALSAGVLYFVANYFRILSNQIIPNSIAATIVQFSVVWTVLIGILVFKEIDMRKHWKRVLSGLVLAVLSIAVLFFGMR